MNDSIRAIMEPSRDVLVLPGHSYRLCRAEEAVLDTTPMQRLRRLRQMGLAYFEFPLAEHSRFVHSIGTAYWATRMYSGLTESLGELRVQNERRLAEIRQILGDNTSLELVIRLYAIVHDVGLLPLGHTLKIQLQRYAGDDYRFDKLFGSAIQMIADECDRGTLQNDEKLSLERHLAVSEAVAHAPRLLRGDKIDANLFASKVLDQSDLTRLLPVLCFIYDLVHGVCAADLIDWCGRDLSAISGSNEFPAFPFSSGAVAVCHPGTHAYPTNTNTFNNDVFRYGIDCRDRAGGGIGALFQVAKLHRLRLEVMLLGNYSGKKIIADAILDKAFRVLDKTFPSGENWLSDTNLLQTIGDDELLRQLQQTLEKHQLHNPATALLNGLNYRNVYDSGTQSSMEITAALIERMSQPNAKDRVESRIARALATSSENVIVSVTPEKMQGKRPDTIVNVGSSGWLPLWMFARDAGIVPDMATIEDAYRIGARICILVHQDAKVPADSSKLVVECLKEFADDVAG